MKDPKTDGKLFLEQKTRNFVDAITAGAGPPLPYAEAPFAEARLALEALQSGGVPREPADIEDCVLPTVPMGDVPVRIFRPAGVAGRLPVVMYFHGGGWVLGSGNTHDRLVRKLAAHSGAAFVFVNYTLSPDAQFPLALEQAYAATKYVAQHGYEMGLDASRLAVAGDSAGGNMAAAVTLLAKERERPFIWFQILFYPVTDASFETGSYAEFANGPWLTRAAMERFWDAYAPNEEDRKQILGAPLRATPLQLRRLPRPLILTAENDVLRDESSRRDRVGGASRPRPPTPPYVLVCIRRFRLMFERIIFEDQRLKALSCEPIGGHSLMRGAGE